MANLGNQKIKDTYQLVLQTDSSGNLQNLSGGTPNPFIVNGNLRYVDGNQANGYVLLSDASGNASWGAVVPGDIYISGGSINGTTIELNTTSGNTVSIPGLSWSSSTSGHISNSGLTGNVGIGTTTPNEKLTVVGDISGTTDLHIGRNITTTNNLTVNGDTLYGNSATGNVGVGNLNPTHKLTISGNTFNLIILAVGQSMVCAENDRRVRFEGGATTESLVAGMQLKIVDGNGITQTVTIDEIVSDYIIYLTVPFPGSDVTATTFRRSTTQNTNQFAVYSGSNTAFQVSGDVVMSGSTDLLDIFTSSAITNQDVYWSANTDGSISTSGVTDVKISGNTHVQGNLGVTGNTNINGVLSGLTNARFSGNLGISGITTSTGGFVGDLVGTATTATTVLVTDNESGNDNNLLVFVGEGTTTTGSQSLQMDGDLYYNPSIGKLHVPLTLQMPDSATIKLGDSQDLKLYHDGDDSYIKENGTGDLIIQTNSNVIIEGTGGENCAVFVDEGGVELYYDNTKKFETTTDGVTMAGAIAMGTNKVTGMGDPTAAQDAATKNYVDTRSHFVETTFILKLFAGNTWSTFNTNTGGLNTNGYWNTDTAVTGITDAYTYVDTAKNTLYTTPYAGKIKRLLIQGVSQTGAMTGDDVYINLAKATVTNGADRPAWTQVTATTKTLPASKDNHYIWDITIDMAVSQYDVFTLFFKNDQDQVTWLPMNLLLEFEYTIT